MRGHVAIVGLMRPLSMKLVAIEQYRFVWESGLLLKTMIDAARLSAKTLLKLNKALPQEMKARLERVARGRRKESHFDELDALRDLDGAFPDNVTETEQDSADIVRRLVKVVWGYVFMHYFWLKERESSHGS